MPLANVSSNTCHSRKKAGMTFNKFSGKQIYIVDLPRLHRISFLITMFSTLISMCKDKQIPLKLNLN